MADHSELVSELLIVEKMSTQERLRHAKKRRNQQLKKFGQYERQLDKDANKKNKKHIGNKKPQIKKQRTIRVNFDNNVMLLEAAARNDINEVRNLLEKGVSPDVTNEDGLTALHQCCIDDSEGMMKLLLEFHANVDARDSELWTPLHAAATCGHNHLCKYLIDNGAELLAVNADGNMPYDICEDENTLDFIESEMAKRGVTQELIDEMRLCREKQMLTDLKLLSDKNGDLEFRDRNGATPLHIAAANGYVQVVEFLLDLHVSLDLRDDDSWQSIHAAACWGQLAILEILVHNGADLDAKTKNGETPHDICEEPEMKQRIIDLKDELEHNRATKSSELRHRRSQNTRSASVRRTSMRDKSAISWKEAREEAKMMRSSTASDDDEEDKNANKARKASNEGSNQLSPPTNVVKPPASTPPKPSTQSRSPPTNNTSNKTVVVIIDDKKQRVPATNIDEVSISVPKGDLPDKGTAQPITRASVEAMLEEKKRERQKNEANTCNSSDISSRESNTGHQTTIPVRPAVEGWSRGGGGDAGAVTGYPAPPPPRSGTLADLKKQRQQHLQNQLHKSKSGLSINTEGLPPANATNGNGSLPQNGHSPNLSISGRSSPNTTPNNSMFFPPPPHGEPPKHRFTATHPSEIVGDNGNQTCCIIL